MGWWIEDGRDLWKLLWRRLFGVSPNGPVLIYDRRYRYHTRRMDTRGICLLDDYFANWQPTVLALPVVSAHVVPISKDLTRSKCWCFILWVLEKESAWKKNEAGTREAEPKEKPTIGDTGHPKQLSKDGQI